MEFSFVNFSYVEFFTGMRKKSPVKRRKASLGFIACWLAALPVRLLACVLVI